MWDVAVVGAGPSGSIAAYLLARMGFKTLLLDMREFPRPKPCGGGITLKAGQLLEELGLPLEPVEAYHRDVAVKGYGWEVVVSTPPGEFAIAVVKREQFDKKLLDEAISSGATFRISKVIGVRDMGGFIRLLGPNEEARYVIGADGANSVTAISSGVRRPWDKDDLIIGIEGEAPHHNQLVFMVDAAPYGYGWIFPRARDSNAGVGGMIEKSREIMSAFQRFSLRFQVRRNGSWVIPAGGHGKPIARGRILLVGDAAGLADPLTGEGIYYAIRSSLEAVKSLESDNPAEKYVERMSPILEELKAKRRAARIIMPRMKFFFELFTAYPEIARRYMLTSIGKVEFKEFWRWAIARVPRALIKSRLGI